MALLVVQLARFGDIFQTWPTLLGLRRSNPGAEIHLLVRERFVEATKGLENHGIRVHTLPTGEILSPIGFDSDLGLKSALERLELFLQYMRALNVDKIINLSFSPFSSYLVDSLSRPNTEIRGYTRFEDGYLRIPDDPSAYFYAQVGVGRHNRYHLCDVFAAVAGVDLIEGDFNHPQRGLVKNGSIVIHIGASQMEKAYPAELWVDVLRILVPRVPGPIILVGSTAERALGEAVAKPFENHDVVVNRVGDSSIADLCAWISEARMLIGADSAPVQIASIMSTPVLNLSCAGVNFWETGPLTPNSVVLYGDKMAEISPQRVAGMAMHMLNEAAPLEEGAKQMMAIRRSRELGFEAGRISDSDEYFWRLIQALYTNGDYPQLPAGVSRLGFQRLHEVALLALDQCGVWRLKGPSPECQAILESVDQILKQLPEISPEVEPVVSWFQTERLRIGPGSADEILKRTTELFEQLAIVTAVYHRPASAADLTEKIDHLSTQCIPALREFEFQRIQIEFQHLLAAIHEVAHDQTKVGMRANARSWSSVLKSLSTALETRDFIEMADLLEFELPELIRDKSSGHVNIFE